MTKGKTKLISILLLTAFASGCNHASTIAKTEEQQKFESLLAKQQKTLREGYYMIVPVEGCHKCMEYAIHFSKQHLNDDSIAFVLSSEAGMKRIRVNYSQKELDATNVIVDSRAEFIRENFTSGLVAISKVKDGIMSKMEIIQPNDVTQRLDSLAKILNR